MTPERWQALDALFDGAVGRPAEERAAWLREACGDDPSLLAEVKALLEVDGAGTAVLDAPVAGEVARLLLDPREIRFAGRRLGPYRLRRELGRGGAGTVYLADRDDGRYRQQVAVKIIDATRASAESRRRFAREQHILARLEHPNIARLLDAGTTAEGLPYVVMERIEGEPIDRWCDARALGIGERLRLFRTVCSAVHYAHQNLVIHRDLKPGNILVTGDGIPKLLDFGIAKWLDPKLDPAALHHTAPSFVPMTPAYASPEQVRAAPITTASDVYSLGVLLYLLLTGRSPYELAGRGARQIERQICETEPLPPSAAVGAEGARQGWRQRLEGDLDAIVLQALRKEPQRRYASAEQLSDDLGRHLLHLPVRARRDTWSYRTGKLLRRHRLASALVTLLIFLAAAMTVQSVRATRGWEAAARQSERAEQVTAVLVSLFEVADPDRSRGASLTAREALDLGAGPVLEELTSQPLTQAALMETVGLVYQKLGLFDDAGPLFEKALATRRRHLGERHPDVARSLGHVAYQRLVEGDPAAAEALYQESLAMRRELYGERHLEVAASLHDLGETHHERGQLDAAGALYLEALAMRRELGGEDHPAVAESLVELARLHLDRGDHTAAVRRFRRALEIEILHRGEKHTRVALLQNDLARTLRHDAPEEAEGLLRRSLATYRQLVGAEHTWTTITMRNLGRLLRDRGAYAEAEALMREALDARRRQWPADDPRIAYALQDLGLLALVRGEASRGDLTGAEALLRESWSILRDTLPPGDWRTASARSMHGESLSRLGRHDEAEAALLESYQTLADALGAGHRRTLRTAERLLAHYQATGEAQQAAVYRDLLAAAEDP